MKERTADLVLLLVAMIWGTGFIAVQVSLDAGITPFQTMAIRFSVAAVLLVIIFFKKLKKINIFDLRNGFIVGIFLFLGFAFQTIGLQYTTPAKNALLTSTNVVIVPFLVFIITKKKPDNFVILASFLTFIGIALISTFNLDTINMGDVLTLICAVFFAMHISLVGYFVKQSDAIVLSVTQIVFASIFSVISMFVVEPFTGFISFSGLLGSLYLGIFSTLLCFLMQVVAQKYTTSTKTAILLSTEALFGSLFSILIFKEIFTVRMIIGAVLIFTSVIMAETKLEFLRKKA